MLQYNNLFLLCEQNGLRLLPREAGLKVPLLDGELPDHHLPLPLLLETKNASLRTVSFEKTRPVLVMLGHKGYCCWEKIGAGAVLAWGGRLCSHSSTTIQRICLLFESFTDLLLLRRKRRLGPEFIDQCSKKSVLPSLVSCESEL